MARNWAAPMTPMTLYEFMLEISGLEGQILEMKKICCDGSFLKGYTVKQGEVDYQAAEELLIDMKETLDTAAKYFVWRKLQRAKP